MLSINIPKQHISMKSANAIDKICEPLSKQQINFFQYMSIDNNGGCMLLTNNKEWLQHYFNKEYYKQCDFLSAPFKHNSGYALWLNLKSQEILQDAKDNFSIANGLTLIRRSEHEVEFYSFATSPENIGILDFYINNMQFFASFIQYFKDHASSIIAKAQNEKLQLASLEPTAVKEMKQSYLDNQLNIKRYFIDPDQDLYLTKREFECIKHVAKGKSIKEIAGLLCLSPRTIRFYIENIKEKLNVSRKSDLVNFFWEHFSGLIFC